VIFHSYVNVYQRISWGIAHWFTDVYSRYVTKECFKWFRAVYSVHVSKIKRYEDHD
jgi:hypothetical protein